MDPSYINILRLVRTGLTGIPCSLEGEPDWDRIMEICGYQGLHSILHRAVRISSLSLPSEHLTRLKTGFVEDLRITRFQTEQLSLIFRLMDENGLDYLPVKGAVTKSLYPDPVYRRMSDADIVIRPSQYKSIENMMKELGYSFLYESEHELKWKKSVFCIEFHKTLFDPKFAKYFRFFGEDHFQNAAKTEGSCRYVMDSTEELAYYIAHFAKHYLTGGLRLRSLIDIYYILQKGTVDQERLRSALEAVDLYSFYEILKRTVQKWFSGEIPGSMPADNPCAVPDREGEVLLSAILADTEEGNLSKSLTLQAAAEGKGTSGKSLFGKSRTVIRRVFRPYGIMARQYPLLRKVPVLLPLFWGRRGLEVLLFRRNNLKRFLKVRCADSSALVDAYMDELRLLGLDTAILPEEI